MRIKRRKCGSVSALLVCINAAQALSLTPPQAIDLPSLDYGSLGNLLIGGDFDGISELDYTGKPSLLRPPSTGQDDILYQYSDGTYLKAPFSDGRIYSSCMLQDNETVIVAGNFSRILNQSVSAIAALNMSSMSVTSLGNRSLNGTVNSLWCNGSDVYVGGNFSYAKSSGVAVWHARSNNWTIPDFRGFSEGSTVNSIVSFGSSVVFGGDIKGLRSDASMNSSLSSTNNTLLEPGMQPVSLNLADAIGYGSQGGAATDASQILCPDTSDPSGGWTADLDSTTGYVNVTLAYTLNPTRMRLFNKADGTGTKAFRVVSQPAGSFMNLSYTDEQGNFQTCAATCLLPESNSSVKFTDFEFVNEVPTSSFEIYLLDFYGNKAGLRGLQLFSSGQYSYANNSFNEPRSCPGSSKPSQVTTSSLNGGNWQSISDFMSTKIIDKASFESTNAVLSPIFSDYGIDRGHFAVSVYTPGCQSYGTCSQRGQVNVTVDNGLGSSSSTILYQTNNELKYDVVYNGTLGAGASVTILPMSNNHLPMDFVAYKVCFIYIGHDESLPVRYLFEYSPAKYQHATSLREMNSTINDLGPKLGRGAEVNALLANGSSLIVGGQGFPENVSTSSQLFSVTNASSSIRGISGIGKNDTVRSLQNLNGSIIALSNEQTYNVSGSSSVSTNLGRIEAVSGFSINGTEYWAFSSQGNKLVLWDQDSSAYADLATSRRVSGHVDFTYKIRNITAYFGDLRIIDSEVPGGAITLEGTSVSDSVALPYTFGAGKNDEKGVVKRDGDVGSADANVVLSAMYLNDTQRLLAGHFTATTSNNETAENVLLIQGNKSTPLPLKQGESLNRDSVFYAIAVSNGTAALAGTISGNLGGKGINGLLIFNSSSSSPFSRQPPALGGNANVSAVAFKPNSSILLAGGAYSAPASPGACSSLCMFNTDDSSWSALRGLNLTAGSQIHDLVFATGDRLVFAGNFTTSSAPSPLQLGIYDFGNDTFAPLPQLSGPATQLVVLSNSSTEPSYVVSGINSSADNSVYLQWYNGKTRTWEDVPGNPLQIGSTISALSLVKTQSAAGKSSFAPLGSSNGLLVSGNLILNGSSASVALFDGKWTALYATTLEDGVGQGAIQFVSSQFGGNLKGGVEFEQATSQPHGPRPKPNPNPKPSGKEAGHLMSTGHVVGIACGIAVGCVLVLTLIYLLFEFLFNLGQSRIPYENPAHSRPAVADSKVKT